MEGVELQLETEDTAAQWLLHYLEGTSIFKCFGLLRVRYTTTEQGMGNTYAPALLLLPGFGVGLFHYDQQLRDWGARWYPLLSKLIAWGGLLRVTAFAKTIIRVWWNLLRNPRTIQRMIKLVYADSSVVDDKLIRRMLETTDHRAAFAAFASILFAPQAHTDVGQNLISLKETGSPPVCLIYGKEDPWVVPLDWGQRAKQRNADAAYYVRA